VHIDITLWNEPSERITARDCYYLELVSELVSELMELAERGRASLLKVRAKGTSSW